MNSNEALSRLSEFIQEVNLYYTGCRHALGGDLLISRAMIAFALSDQTSAEVDALIEVLVARKHILVVAGDKLTFSHSFLNLNDALVM